MTLGQEECQQRCSAQHIATVGNLGLVLGEPLGDCRACVRSVSFLKGELQDQATSSCPLRASLGKLAIRCL